MGTSFIVRHLVHKVRADREPWRGLKQIGAARFELTTSCSQSKRSTRLSYAPFSHRRAAYMAQHRNDASKELNFCRLDKLDCPHWAGQAGRAGLDMLDMLDLASLSGAKTEEALLWAGGVKVSPGEPPLGVSGEDH
jgi:hypothetical protein